MKNIYIIGNGFDLSLGLKTSYKDFIKSSIFQKKRNVGLSLFEYLAEVQSFNGWIDVEDELANYSMCCEADDIFYAEYKELCDTLKEYINLISISEFNKNSHAYKLLSDLEVGSEFLILNFNYTDSVSKILKELGHLDLDDKVIHPHGSIKLDGVIFGVGDKSKINDQHVFIYKSTHEMFGLDFDLKTLNSFDNYHFFGHSLGESDHPYFKTFLNELCYRGTKNQMINFYHYNVESLHAIYRQLHILTNHNVNSLKHKVIVKDVHLET